MSWPKTHDHVSPRRHTNYTFRHRHRIAAGITRGFAWHQPSPRVLQGRAAFLSSLGIGIGVLLVLIGLAVIACHLENERAYALLARNATPEVLDRSAQGNPESGAAGSGDSIDWDYLQEQNPNIAAWVHVDGTQIDLPVLEAPADNTDFYLTHDLWDQPSLEGTPFLDHRCGADDAHRLAFGHHLTMGGQFSELQKAYQQAVFEHLGPCHWHTPSRGTCLLLPLCALKADMWYPDIQRFAFAGPQDIQEWCRLLVEASSARCDQWQVRATSATSVVTLVTCSSDLSHQPWRTLVVFVEIPKGESSHVGEKP